MKITINEMDLKAVTVLATLTLEDGEDLYAEWDGHNEDDEEFSVRDVNRLQPTGSELSEEDLERAREYLEDRFWFAFRVAQGAFTACVESIKRDGGRGV